MPKLIPSNQMNQGHFCCVWVDKNETFQDFLCSTGWAPEHDATKQKVLRLTAMAPAQECPTQMVESRSNCWRMIQDAVLIGASEELEDSQTRHFWPHSKAPGTKCHTFDYLFLLNGSACYCLMAWSMRCCWYMRPEPPSSSKSSAILILGIVNKYPMSDSAISASGFHIVYGGFLDNSSHCILILSNG